MRQQLQITFRGMNPSPAMEERIRDYAGRLDDLFDGIVGCHVVVEEAAKNHRHGNPFHVRVDVRVPGKEIVGESEHVDPNPQKSAYEAVQDAFERAERQMARYVATLRDHRA